MPSSSYRRVPFYRQIVVLVCAALAVAGAAIAQDALPTATEPPSDDSAQIDALRERLANLDRHSAELQEQLTAALAAGDQRANELSALRDLVDEQRRQIAKQMADLEKQQQQLEAQAERIAALEDLVMSVHNRLLEVQDQLPDSTVTAAMQERLDRLESSVEEIPELPTDLVSAGDFPGSTRIPGTDAQLKIGGMVKTSLVYNLTALAVDDRFLTAAIPIKGTVEAGKGPRLTLTARSSRFNIDLRTPTGVGHVRAFIEGDFAGADDVFRLRHAYGQFNKYLFGQTWSALVDVTAVPEELDFEGLNARILLRKTQLRGTFALRKKQVTVSIEDPAPDITGATGVSLVPDLIASTKWTLERGHIQTAVVLRQIKGTTEADPNRTYSSFGWGVAVNGKIELKGLTEDNDLRFGLNFGNGFGGYINDLGTQGGQDAILDIEQDRLRTLPVFSAYLAYSHWWQSEHWRSTACFGYVNVQNLSAQPDNAYRRTHRFSVNIIYSPAPRMDAGLEILTGRREDKDRQYGTATQLQLAWYFRF